MANDYVPNLTPVIAIHRKCGRRLFFIGNDGSYCEKCGARRIADIDVKVYFESDKEVQPCAIFDEVKL